VSSTIQEVSFIRESLFQSVYHLKIYRPEKDTPENTTFNYYVSNIRIRSEHCIGFLKGRFQSLRDLRIRINMENNMKFAALWVTACIAVHSFAMDHEDGSIVANDNFYIQGLGIMQAEKAAKEAELLAEEARDGARAAGQNVDVEMVDQEDRDLNLLEGRLRREELKKALLQHINQD
jgi:DDE superfamily endonuclease